MTCVVGYVSDRELFYTLANGDPVIFPVNTIFMGADSLASTDDGYAMVRANRKIFTLSIENQVSMIVGFAGSFRAGQIIQHHLDLPKNTLKKDPFEYMCSEFVPKVEQLLFDPEAPRADDDDLNCCFLVGYQGQLFTVESDRNVGYSTVNYCAIGASEIALGALYVMDKIKDRFTPIEKILTALEAQAGFSVFVRAPFRVEALTPNGICATICA